MRVYVQFFHMLLVLLVIVILFGAGKLPKVMGDVGKGIRNLRKELGGDDEKPGTQEVLPPEDKK